MFDISWTELLLAGLVAMIVLKPGDLPEAMRTLGRFVGKLKGMASEFQGQFHDAMRDAQLDDVKKAIDDVRDLRNLSPIQQVKDTLSQLKDEAFTIQREVESATQLPSEPPPFEPVSILPPAPIAPDIPQEPVAVTGEPAPPIEEPPPKPKARRKAKAAPQSDDEASA